MVTVRKEGNPGAEGIETTDTGGNRQSPAEINVISVLSTLILKNDKTGSSRREKKKSRDLVELKWINVG